MATQARRKREKEKRRQVILDAARKLFWGRGFEATTMPEIAEAAELAPGTLYLYFPGKTALYGELLLEGYDSLIARLRQAVGRRRSARRQAEALIDAFLGFAEDCPEYFDIIFLVVQREGQSARQAMPTPAQMERLQQKEDVCKELAARVLARSANHGSEEDLRRTVDAVWSMLVGLVFYFRKASTDEFRAVAAAGRRVILDATIGAGQDCSHGQGPGKSM
jgi:AcrR family transcriptional regulator